MKNKTYINKTVARISAAVFILLLLSCREASVYKNLQIESVDSSKVKMINIPSLSGKEVGLFSDVYSSVQYIPLESTPKSLVGEVSRLIISKSKYLIVCDRNNSSVMVFDAKGKFRNTIGHCGHGAQEYIAADEIAYDYDRDQVLVYDNAKKAIIYYDIDGNYLNKFQLKYYIRTFDVLDCSHVVVYMDNDADFSNNDVDYNYKVLDNKGKEICAFDPFGEDMCDFNPACCGTFHHYAGKLYCRSPYSSFISEFTTDDLVPRYYLSFGKDRIPQDWKKGNIRDFDEKIKKYSNLVFCENFYETQDYYVMNLIRNRLYCNFVMKKDNSASVPVFAWINDVYGLVSSTQIKNVHEDKVFYVIDNLTFQKVYKCVKDLPCEENISEKYSDIFFEDFSLLNIFANKGIKDQIKSVKDKYRTVNLQVSEKEKESVKKYADNNNPVIQICTLKR